MVERKNEIRKPRLLAINLIIKRNDIYKFMLKMKLKNIVSYKQNANPIHLKFGLV